MSHIIDAVNNFNDNELVFAGLFESYPLVRSHVADPCGDKVAAAANWFSCYDLFEGSGTHGGGDGGGSGSGSGQFYSSIVAGVVHLLCSSDIRCKVSWPTAQRNHFFVQQQKLNILQLMVSGRVSE